jgi:hypothetical protein
MKRIFLAFLVLNSFVLLSSVSLAEENNELIFTYSHDGLNCGKDGLGQEKENNFKIKGLPKFSDYPPEENSIKLLDYAQIDPHPDQLHSLNVRADTKYSSNFNGHYFVVFGNSSQCTGCAYSEIIDTNTGKKFGKMDMYQGMLLTKFKKGSSLIIENFPAQGLDLCAFNSIPPIIFYQVKNNKLIKIKELKLFETEEFKKISNTGND